MSPSSAGVRPVQTNGIEQYIGSYLISTSARPKYNQKNKNIYVQKTDHKPQNNQRNYNNNNNVRPHNNEGWVGGGTIYSIPNYVRKSTPHLEDFHQQSLTRLAIHTHGVPLILAGKNYRKNNYPPKCNSDVRYTKQSEYSKVNVNQSDVKDNCVIDTLSVTSDESSGSNNSENCLPRIIKPRKRRKKDRKPATITVTESEESTTTKSDDVPNLNHEFKDVKEVQIQCSPTSCQCKLCDPSGQIWNIDTSYASKIYSPPPPPIGIDTCIVDNMVTALRRSWNEPCPSSNTLNQENISANVGVIGQGRLSRERKDSETSISAQITHSNVTSSQNLNISTEIVTSANGQKDLEIKFLSFSCSNLNDTCSDSYFSKPYHLDKIVKPLDDARQTSFNSEE